MRARCTTIAALSALLTLSACAQKLPRYPAMSPSESLGVIAERLKSVRTVTSACDITLTDAEGETVRLDGALAAEPPERLRVRAWKFGRAAFDITVVGGELWAVLPEEMGGGAELDRNTEAAGTETDWASRLLVFVDPAFFREAVVVDGATDARTLTVRSDEVDDGEIGLERRSNADTHGGGLVCEIDRPTLTVRRFTMPGASGREILLSDYELIDGVAWPGRIAVRGPDGSVSIRLESTEFNATLPEGAFTPPRRAVRRR